MSKPISDEIRTKIIEKYLTGVGGNTLAKEFNTKAQTVTKIIKQAGHQIRGPGNKLTEADKDEIVKLYQSGLGGNRIAEKFPVGHVTINKTLKKRGVIIRNKNECHWADKKDE